MGKLPQPMLDLGISGWQPIRDGDLNGFGLFTRHYSVTAPRLGRIRWKAKPRKTTKFTGIGKSMPLLLLPDGDALFVWSRITGGWKDVQLEKHLQPPFVYCQVFRNESSRKSSELLLEAEQLAVAEWGSLPGLSYVDASKVRSSNPGFCFLQAGWTRLPEPTNATGVRILIKPKLGHR